MKQFKSMIMAAALAFMAVPAMAAAQDVEPPVAAEPRTDIGAALDTFMSADGDALILLPHRLDKNQLDYSLKSLETVDTWLQAIHTINRLEAGEGTAGPMFTMDGRGDNSVTFAGLYLGEVIRQNAEQVWLWQPFGAFIANNPAHATVLGGEAGFDEYVLVSEQGVATPINQALRRVLNGNIDSLHYIGTWLSQPVDIDAALNGTDFTAMPPMTRPTETN